MIQFCPSFPLSSKPDSNIIEHRFIDVLGVRRQELEGKRLLITLATRFPNDSDGAIANGALDRELLAVDAKGLPNLGMTACSSEPVRHYGAIKQAASTCVKPAASPLNEQEDLTTTLSAKGKGGTFAGLARNRAKVDSRPLGVTQPRTEWMRRSAGLREARHYSGDAGSDARASTVAVRGSPHP